MMAMKDLQACKGFGNNKWYSIHELHKGKIDQPQVLHAMTISVEMMDEYILRWRLIALNITVGNDILFVLACNGKCLTAPYTLLLSYRAADKQMKRRIYRQRGSRPKHSAVVQHVSGHVTFLFSSPSKQSRPSQEYTSIDSYFIGDHLFRQLPPATIVREKAYNITLIASGESA